MIDKTDSKTIDAFPAKKRGRPPTGKAMTPAQRKAAQRKRALLDVRKALEGKVPMSELSLTALITEMEASVRCGDFKTVNRIGFELTERAKKIKK